jgi:hypothetical protein
MKQALRYTRVATALSALALIAILALGEQRQPRSKLPIAFRELGSAPLKVTYVDSTGAVTSSIFVGPQVGKVPIARIRAMFGSSNSSERSCSWNIFGIRSKLAGWLDANSVLACAPDDFCTGHYMGIEFASCGGCAVGSCTSGGPYEAGCTSTNGCCCGQRRCSAEGGEGGD